ncbi:nibrin [Trichonephila clavipes]|uniref:Nibrin n=1 Tax=Trichonephila clavipes TaxID=2585209 RepID=A0A8X6RXZ3_TRICX|nr:nibrin [Trichonephila clavipes]
MSVVSRSFEHHTGDSTIWLSFTPVLREDTWGRQGPPTSLPLPPTSLEDLQLDGYLLSIGGYHPYGLASILTGLESNRACVGYAWSTNCSPSIRSHLSTGTSEGIA